MEMTIQQIVSKIKEFAHDYGFSDSQVYDFINMAIQDIEDYGEFNYQIVKDEQVTIPAGQSNIQLQYPVKRIISVNGNENFDGIVINQGELQLKKPADKDTTLSITYLRKHPLFDGDENNLWIKDAWLLIYGGVYHAMLHNEDPAAAVYRNSFLDRLNKFYQENRYIIYHDFYQNIDALGV